MRGSKERMIRGWVNWAGEGRGMKKWEKEKGDEEEMIKEGDELS